MSEAPLRSTLGVQAQAWRNANRTKNAHTQKGQEMREGHKTAKTAARAELIWLLINRDHPRGYWTVRSIANAFPQWSNLQIRGTLSGLLGKTHGGIRLYGAKWGRTEYGWIWWDGGTTGRYVPIVITPENRMTEEESARERYFAIPEGYDECDRAEIDAGRAVMAEGFGEDGDQ